MFEPIVLTWGEFFLYLMQILLGIAVCWFIIQTARWFNADQKRKHYIAQRCHHSVIPTTPPIVPAMPQIFPRVCIQATRSNHLQKNNLLSGEISFVSDTHEVVIGDDNGNWHKVGIVVQGPSGILYVPVGEKMIPLCIRNPHL